MPTPSELAATRYHLGGSTIGWALGYGERAPSELWEVKTQGREVEETDEMWFGTMIESATRPLAERFLRRELLIDGLNLIPTKGAFHHSKYGAWWAVHPDAINLHHGVLVQLKNHSPRVYKASYKKPTDGDDNDKVPIAYQMQVLWERAAVVSQPFRDVGLSPWVKKGDLRCYLGAYFGGVDLKLYRIGPNARLLDQMIEKGYAFWKAHLDPNGPQTAPDDRFWAQNRDRLQAEEAAKPVRPPRASKPEIARQPIASLDGLV